MVSVTQVKGLKWLSDIDNEHKRTYSLSYAYRSSQFPYRLYGPTGKILCL